MMENSTENMILFTGFKLSLTSTTPEEFGRFGLKKEFLEDGHHAGVI